VTHTDVGVVGIGLLTAIIAKNTSIVLPNPGNHDTLSLLLWDH
jgi:hypothetical protein